MTQRGPGRHITRAQREAWEQTKRNAREADTVRALLNRYAIPDGARGLALRLRQAIDDLDGSPPCSGFDAFTDDDLSPYELDLARKVCRRCPVLAECRAYGIVNPAEWGIYGGQTQKQRRQIAKQRDTTTSEAIKILRDSPEQAQTDKRT